MSEINIEQIIQSAKDCKQYSSNNCRNCPHLDGGYYFGERKDTCFDNMLVEYSTNDITEIIFKLQDQLINAKLFLLQFCTNCCGQIYNYKLGVYSSLEKAREEKEKYINEHEDSIDYEYDSFHIYEFELNKDLDNDNLKECN